MSQMFIDPLPDGTIIANPIYYPKFSRIGITWNREDTTNDRILAKTPDGFFHTGLIYVARPVVQSFISRLVCGKKSEMEYKIESLESIARMKLIKDVGLLDAYNLPAETILDEVPPAYRNVSVVNGSWMLYMGRVSRERKRVLPAWQIRY